MRKQVTSDVMPTDSYFFLLYSSKLLAIVYETCSQSPIEEEKNVH